MMRRAAALALAGLVAAVAASSQALAHPAVWITIKSEIAYSPDGSVTGIRHVWTFDEVFSAYLVRGVEHQTKDVFTREELAQLAETNVATLKESDYFNHAKVDGKERKDVFADAVDYWLDYAGSTLTLHFTLPLKTPIRARDFEVDLYDPEFFFDFAFIERDPVTLANAPTQCTFTTLKATDIGFPSSQRLNRSFQPPDTKGAMGAHFASRILVTCP